MKRTGALSWFVHDVKNRGITGWMLAAVLTAFYIGLYFSWRQDIQRFTATPLSELPGNWKLLGTLYGIALAAGLAYVFTRPEERRKTSPALHAIQLILGVTVVSAIFYITLHGTGHFIAWATAKLDLLARSWLGEEKAKGLVSQWTVYGLLYSLAIVGGGIYVISKYRHNRYQIVRTCVVMFVQVTLAFSVPLFLKILHYPEYYFSYLWPLKIDALYPENMSYHASGSIVFVLYSVLGAILLVPLLAVAVGKRWYCSWVCGCGGLANTFGEPWRHLSDKSSASWKIERFTIHTVLIAAFVTTGLVILSSVLKDRSPAIAEWGSWLKDWYGFLVVSILSGIVGVGLYPIGGTRVWCRFACPMAALLGLTQKFGRYRIRVKQDMCISCGMCSKYCEMGIDVRSYAQANTSFTRASCVGCGLCAEVCPRGVLHLENSSKKDPQELIQITSLDESWKGNLVSITTRV